MDMSPKPHAVDVARATIKRHRADEARAVVSSMKPVELFNTQHAKQVLKTTLNGTCPPPPETPPRSLAHGHRCYRSLLWRSMPRVAGRGCRGARWHT